MPSNPPENETHLKNFLFEHCDFYFLFFKCYRYKIKVKKQPIHRISDPKGRSIRRQQYCPQTANAQQYGYRRLQKLHARADLGHCQGKW